QCLLTVIRILRQSLKVVTQDSIGV
ncbi:unnamed protein product, partial [Allacma fusca]